MIKWCAYCQKFQGEFAPFENKSFSHGICKACAQSGLSHSDEQEKHMRYLAELNQRFWNAGKSGDPVQMRTLAEEGIRAGIRPIDLLYGFAGPLLTQVGELWAAKVLSVADEHAFTAACDGVVTLVSDLVWQSLPSPKSVRPSVLLANIQGNQHSLGLRFTSIGLAHFGIQAEVLAHVPAKEILERALSGQHRTVGLSVALSSQIEELKRTVRMFLDEPKFTGRIVVGGAAVNAGFVTDFQAENVRLLAHPKFDAGDIDYFR